MFLNYFNNIVKQGKRITNMRYYLILVFLLPSVIFAQTDVKSVEIEINAIKKDTSYISAESTTKEWNDALENAKVLLDHNISMWLSEIGTKDTSYIAKGRKGMHEVQGRRGTLYRAFVYVKKSDIMHYSASEEIVISDQNISNEDNKKVVTVVEPSPKAEQKAEETRVVSQCVLKRPLNSFERGLFRITAAQEAQSYVKGLSNDGILSSMGMYKDRPLDKSHYLVIYDKSYSVRSIMFYDGQQLYDLKTLKCDDLSSFKGCGGIWFVLK